MIKYIVNVFYELLKKEPNVTYYIMALTLISQQKWDECVVYEQYITELIKKGYIKRINGILSVVVPDSLSEEQIDEYRELWHYTNTGVKGKMGNRKDIKEKLSKFIAEENITFDEVIRLSQYYLANFTTISGFLQQADYFLYKQKIIDGKKITESRAASLLGEYGDFILDQPELI